MFDENSKEDAMEIEPTTEGNTEARAFDSCLSLKKNDGVAVASPET